MYQNDKSRGRRPRSQPPRNRRHQNGVPSGENGELDQNRWDDGETCQFSRGRKRWRGRNQCQFRGRGHHNSGRDINPRRGNQYRENQDDSQRDIVEYPGWEDSENGFITDPAFASTSEEQIFKKFMASVTFLTIGESANWLSRTRNGVLHKIARDLISGMERYSDKVNKLQFMNRLLSEQESYGRSGYRSAQPIKLILLFVRLYEGICALLPNGVTMDEFIQTVPEFGEDVAQLIKRFNTVFKTTLSHVMKNPHKAAKGHLNILNSLRLECEEIGLHIEFLELENDQIPQEAYVSRNDSLSVSVNTSSTVISSEKNMIDELSPVSTASSSPIVESQGLGKKVHGSFHQSDGISNTEYDEESESDYEGFIISLRGKEDFLDIFRRTRNLFSQRSFNPNPVEFKTLVTTLVDCFRKGHRIGKFNLDLAFFEILFNEKHLNNTGRKAVMWTVAEICSARIPTKLFKTEAEKLLRIVKDFDVSECDPKWDTIELLAIRNRFRIYLPPLFLTPIDCLIARIIVKKYKMIQFYDVCLDIDNFYPRKLSTLQLMADAVLEEIPEINDFVQRCKELQNKHYSVENKKRATSPAIICLGPAVKPIPDVVTLD